MWKKNIEPNLMLTLNVSQIMCSQRYGDFVFVSDVTVLFCWYPEYEGLNIIGIFLFVYIYKAA